VSLHTAVKGQFGLGTGRAMGKALKKMRFSNIARRKKRKLSLLPVHPSQETPTMSFIEPLLSSTHREIAYYHGCVQMHKAFCGCDNFLTHLQRITTFISANQHTPPSTPSNTLRRARALPAAPEPAPWRGPGGGRGGAEGGRGEGEGGEDYAPEDLDALFDAVARDTE